LSAHLDNWSRFLDKFLMQAQSGDLKFAAYPKEWDGLRLRVSFG
jgi:hypothetical protein